jgi:hypothetical protein
MPEPAAGPFAGMVALLTFAFAGRNDVGGRIWIGNIVMEPLANDVGGEQTFNGGKAGQVA